jgi:hypothetical protein
VKLSMEIVPVREVELSLGAIAQRGLAQEPAWELAMRAQERRQEFPFRRGALTRTGRLRDSLTQPNADGAIRAVHADSAEFGTTIRYARAAAHKKGRPVLMHPVPALAELMLRYVVHGSEL